MLAFELEEPALWDPTCRTLQGQRTQVKMLIGRTFPTNLSRFATLVGERLVAAGFASPHFARQLYKWVGGSTRGALPTRVSDEATVFITYKGDAF
jgi:hypothetical protein